MTNSKKSFLYFLGQLGLMLQLRFFFQWILEFYKESSMNVGSALTPAIVGVILLLFRILDAISDPIIGDYSDSLLSRGIRRSRVMRLGIPLISLGLMLSFLNLSSLNSLSQYFILSFSLFCFFAGYTLYCVPFWALIEDLSRIDKNIASSLSRSLGAGIFMASALSFILTPIIISRFDYFISAIVICIISSILMILPLGLDKNLSTVNSPNLLKKRDNFFSQYFIPLKDSSFLIIIMLLGSIQASLTILTSISASFVELVIEKDKSYMSYIMGPVILLGMVALVILKRLVNNYNIFSLVRFFVFIQGVFFIFCYPLYLIVDKASYLSAYAFLFGLFGIPVAVILGIEALLVNRVTPHSSYAGLYFGSFNFLIKTINGFSIMLTGFVLSYVDKANPHNIPLFLSLCGVGIVLVSMFCIISANNNILKKI